MILLTLRMILFSKKADYLVLDIDAAFGPLSLCARKIVLMVDDRCQVVDGGWPRILQAALWPFRWIRVLVRYAVFMTGARRGQAFAAQTPEAFRKKLEALGGTRFMEAK
jgi:hypothetical protein